VTASVALLVAVLAIIFAVFFDIVGTLD